MALITDASVILMDGSLSELDGQFDAMSYEKGGALLTTVVFATACAQPLRQGDYYGSLRLSEVNRQSRKRC